jgi:acetolactate synthase I/II/III large subunit
MGVRLELDDRISTPMMMTAFPVAVTREGRFVDALVRYCEELGIEESFGVIGGGCASIADALGRSPIRVYQARHEGSAAFQAVEASLATKRPVILFTTTGPGLLNALNGIVSGRWDGAQLLVLSAATSLSHTGRLPVQETSRRTMPLDALYGGPHFDFGALVVDPSEFPTIQQRLRVGFSRPQGFIAHLGLPSNIQVGVEPELQGSSSIGVARPRYSSETLSAVADILEDGPFALWLGYGARRAAPEISTLIERVGTPFMCTPRGKGIVSEHHPLYLGVTGAGGHNEVASRLRELGIKRVMVLGTRMGEASSFFSPGLVPSEGFVHVDVDAAAFGQAYPTAPTVGIEAEIGAFVDNLTQLLRPRPAPKRVFHPFPEPVDSAPRAPVRVPELMRVLQEIVVDGSDALVFAESGNAFGWCNHYLRFDVVGRYRSSASWGSMGQMVAGGVGAALATGRRSFIITGDGAMLMNNEINTAVQYSAPVVWVVLNDAGYGIVRDGMRALGLAPVGCEFPRTDFVNFARSQGAAGMHVRHERELTHAFREAVRARVPYVIDVDIGRGQLSPAFAQRNRSLATQQQTQDDER